MTALLLALRLGEPEPAPTVAAPPVDAVAAASVTPTPPASSRLSAEVKWQEEEANDEVKWPDEVDDVDEDEVAEWTLVGAANDVNDDEEDELPHLDDAVDVIVPVPAPPPAALPGANSDERKDTERRGDEVVVPFRTPPDRVTLLLIGPLVWGGKKKKKKTYTNTLTEKAI